MDLEVVIGGRRRRVTVTGTGGRFAVTVDGTARDVDVVRIGPETLSLIVDNLWPADVIVTPNGGGQLAVYVNGLPVAAALNNRRRWGAADDAAGAADAPQQLTAPMPGRVARVLVAVGDEVQPRQPVVVVEAMKMENELRAARAGIVAAVHVAEGASVDAGAPLVVIR